MGLIGSNVPSPHGPMLQRWPFVVQLVRSELAALVGPRYGSIQGKQDIFFKDSSQKDTLLIFVSWTHYGSIPIFPSITLCKMAPIL